MSTWGLVLAQNLTTPHMKPGLFAEYAPTPVAFHMPAAPPNQALSLIKVYLQVVCDQDGQLSASLGRLVSAARWNSRWALMPSVNLDYEHLVCWYPVVSQKFSCFLVKKPVNAFCKHKQPSCSRYVSNILH